MKEYEERFEALLEVARRLRGLLHEYLARTAHIDRIAARAKEPDRFAAKAKKVTDDGKPKYVSPLTQIQDQLAARVIVYYKSDVEAVAQVLNEYFRPVEAQDLVPESDWEFGYFGRHWIFALPGDAVPEGIDRDLIPRFFELQVKTLFQHAWSEAEHDLGYKATGQLESHHYRRFAYAAAQAWGADEMFDALYREFVEARRLHEGSV